jgi:preprotein translocase subunit SecF
MELFRRVPNFDFLGKQRFFIALSVILMTISVYYWISLGDQKYGVDFRGGHDLLISFQTPMQPEEVRETLRNGGVPDPTVVAFGEKNEFSVRIQEQLEASELQKHVTTALDAKFKDKYEILKTEFVGPTVGAELRKKALLAVGLGLLCILAYTAFRFEFAFGLGAVFAIFHDVIVSMGLYLLAGSQINMSTLAGALTILGYSVNDTIVIFDRVREEILRNKSGDTLSQIVNRSINFTLSRTLITHVLTFFAVLSLFLFGGGELRDLSLYLLAGIVVGSYSTIYIASPITIAWHKFRGGTEQV